MLEMVVEVEEVAVAVLSFYNHQMLQPQLVHGMQ